MGAIRSRVVGAGVVGAALLLVALAPAVRADGGGNSVRWRTIIGIIQAGNVVGGIGGGMEPWSTLGGHAYVDLADGAVDFEVRGLVLAGGDSIGTPATVTQVKGTLVCAPESASAGGDRHPARRLERDGRRRVRRLVQRLDRRLQRRRCRLPDPNIGQSLDRQRRGPVALSDRLARRRGGPAARS